MRILGGRGYGVRVVGRRGCGVWVPGRRGCCVRVVGWRGCCVRVGRRGCCVRAVGRKGTASVGSIFYCILDQLGPVWILHVEGERGIEGSKSYGCH